MSSTIITVEGEIVPVPTPSLLVESRQMAPRRRRSKMNIEEFVRKHGLPPWRQAGLAIPDIVRLHGIEVLQVIQDEMYRVAIESLENFVADPFDEWKGLAR